MKLQRWLSISFINLLLVSVLGILLRYKIAFSLPIVHQKYVLHSHSHFAFTGWITQTLLVLLVYYLQQNKFQHAFARYNKYLWLNLISAYGMLISFMMQGYGLYSISFSTLSIFTAWGFAYRYWKDLNKIGNNGITHHWFKAALLFNAISSLGAFSLAYMMAMHISGYTLHLSAIYFFLHFQYNGWFFFACMGLFFYATKLYTNSLSKKIFWWFALACVPAYFLSILWAAIHPALYAVVVASAVLQTGAWILFIRLLKNRLQQIKDILPVPFRWLFLLSVIACTIKIILQLSSVIPVLSNLAFGFRPIVIGYLHLVLLGVISLFLLGYIFNTLFTISNKGLFYGLIIFTAGIFINEILLMIQGIAAFSNALAPNLNEYLLLAAIIMFSGILVINASIKKGAITRIED